MQILRAPNYKRMPWKNGGGETVEIAVFPPDASVDDFDWRISMATVARDGPFSAFPGIDRTLCILDGEGMSLAVGDAEAVALTQHSAPFAFAADIATEANLRDGPITDLNVMTRRGAFSHSVMRLSAGMSVENVDATGVLLLVTGDTSVQSDGQAFELSAMDACWVKAKTSIIAASRSCYAIRIDRL